MPIFIQIIGKLNNCKQSSVVGCRFQNESAKVEIALRIVQFWSIPALQWCDFVIARLILVQIKLHSVQLPSLINDPLIKVIRINFYN